MKQTLVSMLRLAGLMRPAERLAFEWRRLRDRASNRRFRAANPGFAVPPERLLYEVTSSTSYQWYKDSGEHAARIFLELFDAHAPPGPLSVCEWGCGVGRIIRHWHDLDEQRFSDLTGIDSDGRMIDWCRSAIPGVQFETNASHPPTGLAPGRFDVVYAFSVLTHLSRSTQLAWMREIARILKAGGIFVFSTMSDRAAMSLHPWERRRYDAGELIERAHVREGARTFAAYASESFVHDELLRGWNLLAHVKPGDGRVSQDLWVVRK